jgi:hypothetical protein
MTTYLFLAIIALLAWGIRLIRIDLKKLELENIEFEKSNKELLLKLEKSEKELLDAEKSNKELIEVNYILSKKSNKKI